MFSVQMENALITVLQVFIFKERTALLAKDLARHALLLLHVLLVLEVYLFIMANVLQPVQLEL